MYHYHVDIGNNTILEYYCVTTVYVSVSWAEIKSDCSPRLVTNFFFQNYLHGYKILKKNIIIMLLKLQMDNTFLKETIITYTFNTYYYLVNRHLHPSSLTKTLDINGWRCWEYSVQIGSLEINFPFVGGTKSCTKSIFDCALNLIPRFGYGVGGNIIVRPIIFTKSGINKLLYVIVHGVEIAVW